MKNYELITKLSGLPAGAEIQFCKMVNGDDVDFQDEEYCAVTENIEDVELSSENVINLF